MLEQGQWSLKARLNWSTFFKDGDTGTGFFLLILFLL